MLRQIHMKGAFEDGFALNELSIFALKLGLTQYYGGPFAIYKGVSTRLESARC